MAKKDEDRIKEALIGMLLLWLWGKLGLPIIPVRVPDKKSQ